MLALNPVLIFCYINNTLDWRQIGFIGDPPDKLRLDLFVDSDFAGARRDMKSTSGVFLRLLGPHTFFPLGAIAKKQTSTSHSSPEAELVALDLGVREEEIPALTLWETLLGREPIWICTKTIRLRPRSSVPVSLKSYGMCVGCMACLSVF